MKTLKSIFSIACTLMLCACGGGSSYTLPKFISERSSADIVPIPYADNSGWVLVNSEGREVSQKYDEISFLHEGLAVFAKTETNDSTDETTKLYGYLDAEGKVAIEPVYASASGFSDGLAWVSNPDSTLVAIDKNGTVKLQLPQAKIASVFMNGYAVWADVCDKDYLIDKNGNNIDLPANIKSMYNLVDEYFFAKTDEGDKFFAIKDNKVNEVEALSKFELVSTPFIFNDVFIVRSGDNYGLVNMNGEYVVNPQYPKINYFENFYSFQTEKEKIGLLNAKGEELLSAKYKDVKGDPIESKYLILSTNGTRYNVADMKGESVGKGKYDAINILTPTLFAVKKDGKFGILDATTGELCCTPQFDRIGHLGNVLLASTGDNYAVINKEGKILSDEVYAYFGTMDSSGQALTDHLSVDQICRLTKMMIDDLPLNVNAEKMATEIGVSKSQLSSSETLIALKDFGVPSVYVNLYAQFNRPPLVVRGYRGRTDWNSNSSPIAYVITMNFYGDSQKCGDVVKMIVDNRFLSLSEWEGFEKFTDCSAFVIAIDATTGQAKMEPYIVDY